MSLSAEEKSRIKKEIEKVYFQNQLKKLIAEWFKTYEQLSRN